MDVNDFSIAAYFLKALPGRRPMQNRRSAEAAVANQLCVMCGVCVCAVGSVLSVLC